MDLGLHYWNFSAPGDPQRIADTLAAAAQTAEEAGFAEFSRQVMHLVGGQAGATATSVRFREDMKVPDWFDPGQVDVSDSASPAARIPAESRFVVFVGCVCLAHHCVHGDVLTTPGWMVPTRTKTVDYLDRQRFPPQEVIHRPVGNGKIRAEHQHHVSSDRARSTVRR